MAKNQGRSWKGNDYVTDKGERVGRVEEPPSRARRGVADPVTWAVLKGEEWERGKALTVDDAKAMVEAAFGEDATPAAK